MIPWKLVDAAFSRIWLLLVPIVVVPVIVLAMTSSEPRYTSQASIWVTRPENVDPGVLFNTASWWDTPAIAQSNIMRDLLSTESFRTEVAEAAGIEGSDPAWYIAQVASITASGNNLIYVQASTPNSDDGPGIVTAIIDEYGERASTAAAEISELQVEYLSTQLTPATEELEARKGELAAYDAANPGSADDGVGVIDPERERLISSVESQQMIVESYLQSLQEAQRSAASAPQALAATFSVQDPASEPMLIGDSTAQQFGYPLVGLLFGAGISACYLYVIYRTDHAIRTSQDLAELPVPLLGFVPQLGRRRTPGFFGRAPMRWLNFGRNRDYARNVAASISSTSSSEASS